MLINETTARNFLQGVLQPLQDDEVYILLLCTRKKYCPSICRSEEIVDRAIIRDTNIDKIIRKIKKMSNVEGIYGERDTNQDIPKEAFALYILLDPRSTLKAYPTFNSDINKWLYPNLKGSEKDLTLFRKMDIKLFSAILSYS